MKFKFSVIVLIIAASLVISTESAKILGLFTTFSRSHLIVHMSVIRSLFDRGHNITVVTTQSIDNKDPRYRHIQIAVPGSTKEFLQGSTKRSQSKQGPLDFIEGLKRIKSFVSLQANASLHDPQMRKLMADETFDLVLLGHFFNDFQIGVAAHFKCPLIIVFMQKPMASLNAIVGNPQEPLYVPHLFLGSRQSMAFFDRVKNVLVNFGDFVVFSVVDYYYMKFYYDSNFPSDKNYPSFDEMRKNVSLILSNHHFTNGPIRPNVPAVIDIGGIQIKPKSDPLPDDLGKFFAGASKHGAIFFSLGSNARSADLDPDTIRTVYQVLSKLKQRVIWKWEEDETPGNASNILFRKWLPQDDILADPNVKLFITHGGHGSVVESEYHGVPMVGMPLFADQFANLDAVHSAGYGISLGKQKLTEEIFRNAVLEVLEKPKYRGNVQRFSQLYRDRPISARDTAAFWIEYVIRHRGAKHLQSPAVHMNTIQYYGLDVIAFLVAVAYIAWKILKGIFKLLFSLVYRLRKGNVQDKKDNNMKKVQ